MGSEERKQGGAPDGSRTSRVPRPTSAGPPRPKNKTMIGVAPAANTPQAFPNGPGSGAGRSPSRADNAATLHTPPPDMGQAMAEVRARAPSLAPDTTRSAPPPSVAPPSAPRSAPPPLPRPAPSSEFAPRASSPQFAPPGSPGFAPPAPFVPPHLMRTMQMPPPIPVAPPAYGSSPSPMQVHAAPDGFGGQREPLTYQVYAPDELPSLRSSMMLSRASFSAEDAPKSNVKLRVGLALLGVLVMIGTTALAIAGAADDPPPADPTQKSASAAVTAPATVEPSPSLPLTPDPTPAVVEATAEPAAPAVTPARRVKKAKPKPAHSAAHGAAIPPNPFGAPTKSPKKK